MHNFLHHNRLKVMVVVDIKELLPVLQQAIFLHMEHLYLISHLHTRMPLQEADHQVADLHLEATSKAHLLLLLHLPRIFSFSHQPVEHQFPLLQFQFLPRWEWVLALR